MSKSGTFIYGRLVGYTESAWASNGRSGLNRRLGIVARSYTDSFGQVQENTTIVDVSEAMVPYVKECVAKFTGKPVAIQVVYQAKKGGAQGAFLSVYLPKDSLIELQAVDTK